MADNNYEIYYGSGLKQGVEEAAAIKALANLLKLEEQAAAGIIRNTNRIIKSGLNASQAERYRSLLDGVGLKVEIRNALATAYDSVYEPTQAPPPAQGPPDARGDDAGEPCEYPVQFHGKGFEYFKIWIVNVLLSILTLGIYSAWAKVRNKQYFYGNTEIDGSSFQYTAKPLQILKGRFIAFVIFLIYVGIDQLFPLVGLLLMLVYLLFLPWIVIRSLTFNARNNMYRNIRFHFSGGVGEAVMAFMVMPFLTVLTLGLMLPFAWHRKTRFFVNNHHFGTTPFEFDTGVGPYYRLLLKVFLIGIGALIVVVEMGDLTSNGLLLLPVIIGFYVLFFAIIAAGLTNLRFNNSHLEEVYFNSRLTVGGMAWLYFTNTLGIIVSLGLLIPWAKVRTAAYRASCLTLVAPGLDGFIAAEEKKVSALGEQIGEVFDVDILGT